MKRLLSILSVGLVAAMFGAATANAAFDYRIKYNGLASGTAFTENAQGSNGSGVTGRAGLFRYVIEPKNVGTPAIDLDWFASPAKNGNEFLSFCIELDENTTTSWRDAQLNVTGSTSQAIAGGINTNAGDPLSYGTAWLYYQFATNNWVGSLAPYAPYGTGSLVRHMQMAIWYLEDELNNNYYASNYTSGGNTGDILELNPFLAAMTNGQGALDALYSADYNAAQQFAGGYLVRGVNIGSSNQDTLIVVRTEPTEGIPEPATMAIWTLGLAFGGFGLRRFRRR